MPRKLLCALLVSLFLICLFTIPSIADSFTSLCEDIMLRYSSSAYNAAQSASGQDVGLDLTAREEYIYRLGIARGYDLCADNPNGVTDNAVYVWIPTKGGSKYHATSTCSNMKNPVQILLETALASDYEPCKRCKPPQ